MKTLILIGLLILLFILILKLVKNMFKVIVITIAIIIIITSIQKFDLMEDFRNKDAQEEINRTPISASDDLIGSSEALEAPPTEKDSVVP
ncbi:MAG: hypothetical protein KKF44_05100 [Nanoarchaeota archaeon]|nr:hypothetical protein [Nanoarchaeota archaeon]